jgi:septum site-determining protein MinC
MPALTVFEMLTCDLSVIKAQLVDHLQQMPQFFLYAPVLVDLKETGDRPFDLARLASLFREYHLVPVAVRNPTPEQEVRAAAAGWGVLQSGLSSNRRPPAGGRRVGRGARVDRGERGSAAPSSPDAAESSAGDDAGPGADDAELELPGLTVRSPVRSGQVVRAVGGDLVVLAPVSSGAELIADGNIHVYAPLRGRALAGARGNADASIFCLALEAEFLSVAGHYLRADQIDEALRGRAVRAHLSGEGLTLSPL